MSPTPPMSRSFNPRKNRVIGFRFAAPSMAQKTVSTGTGGGGSPHEKTTWTVDGATISIEYGRPFLKGRPESQMMPAGQLWRTGADQATVLTTDKPLTFGTVKLAPGGYHLMLQDLKGPFKEGEKVPVTLTFEKAGKVAVSLEVQGVGAQAPGGGGMMMKKMPDHSGMKH